MQTTHFILELLKNIKRIVEEHNNNNNLGAKSLRYRCPVVLVYFENFETQTEAAERERSIKRWTRKYKLKLIERFTGLP